jgi:hypothetical protein
MAVGLAALGLFAHGLLHLLGFVVPWRYADIDPLHADEAVGGRIHLSGTAARIVGLLWLLVGTLFVLGAAGLLLGAGWALPLIAAAATGSVPLCLAKLPEMAIGAAVDVVILVVVVPILLAPVPLPG